MHDIIKFHVFVHFNTGYNVSNLFAALSVSYNISNGLYSTKYNRLVITGALRTGYDISSVLMVLSSGYNHCRFIRLIIMTIIMLFCNPEHHFIISHCTKMKLFG